MATRRQGRTGIFKGASRTPRKAAPTGPQAALAALKGVTYAWDLGSDALTWGPNAADVLGLSPSVLPRTGRAFAQMIEPGSGLDRRDAMAADERGNRTFDGCYALRLSAGHVLMVQDAGRWQVDAEGRPSLLRGLLRADPAASAPELLPAAIKARSALFRQIQDQIDEAAQLSHTCTLIAGAVSEDDDVSIGEVARALRPMLRRGDRCDALGTNRFALTLACCPASEAPGAMKRAAALIKADAPDLTLHLGAACSPDHTFEAVKLMRFAAQALDRAVARSETAVLHKMHHGTKPKAAEQASFDLAAILNDRRLILTGQPLVDAPSRQPALVQACPAVGSPDGMSAPTGLVRATEEANVALLVDGRLLELAADHLARHHEARLALLVSAATLRDREWLPMLAAHLGARPGIASRLIVQVPEAVAGDPEAALAPLNTMKAFGVGIGLTGFGTGHASLAALQSLPVDLAVIDGVFVQSLKRSTDDRLFVRTLIDMARHLGIATAAEGVDEEASARLLSAWGIDYMQGALFGEAKPLAQPETLLQRLRRA
ncbi:EAL domain-containing protein [Microvirga subterranea]|uniref:Diguanylate cyclase/phosphodiesterase n=1 Tax=Microvirga subterranea TaxID=186651 RepID=A0A370HTI4_9HYPH|nr:GGDEF domain-containing phosphodiesterase [Microvirga subterranea]RDI61828.1 diguanylate cyclase/phosphodiesterase [Microvirga subterranea]